MLYLVFNRRLEIIRENKSFTLIELIVVLIIIGILTAIAVLTIQNMQAKAICIEAVMGVSAIRTAMNLCSMECGEYPRLFKYFNAITLPGFSSSSLSGTYFNQQCYYMMCYGGNTPWQWANGPDTISVFAVEVIFVADGVVTNDAPMASKVRNIVDDPNDPNSGRLLITAEGRVFQRGISKSGYPPF